MTTRRSNHGFRPSGRKQVGASFRLILILALVVVLCALGVGSYFLFFYYQEAKKDAFYEEALLTYMQCIAEGDYAAMYEMLDEKSKSAITQEEFITRNSNIYTGIEARNIEIELLAVTEESRENKEIVGSRHLEYRMRMDTLAGPVSFTNATTVSAYKNKGAALFQLEWNAQCIFPALRDEDKVRVSTTNSKRGGIFDRNGLPLAGSGIIKSVGFVPGKMREDATEDILAVSEILELSVESIENRLAAKWVKDDLFVPLKSLRAEDVGRKELLLQIPGILIRDETDRIYPLGQAAAHLTGYIQSINKEELDARPGQFYHSNSKLGKIGLESLLEQRVRGIDGCKIAIVDENGKETAIIADQPAIDGENIYLTIDSRLQNALYEKLQADKGAAVAINPYTGEVLALLSTPAYDPNEFILGLTERLWQEWNQSEQRPLYNRFKATFSPGSSIKPIMAAIGITTGKLMPEDNLGYHGRSWQKDATWGSYHVTTLKEYGNDVTMRNALIYSDNIFFAKAALRIGGETLIQELHTLGFGEAMPFLFGLTPSAFGADGGFSSEIELADSGFGQGRVLMNPLHMASIYSAFLNQGNMIAPYLEKGTATSYWKQGVFTAEASEAVRGYLLDIVESPNGTAHEVMTPGLSIGGKTGTAEIKDNKQDETGTELGWFASFCEQKELLIVVMVEDVKGRGGSHYVLPIVKSIFEAEPE